MKMYLMMKHSLRENYKYLLTLMIAYGFLGILYYLNEEAKIVMSVIALGLTLCNALTLPNILYKNYYQSTNANHLASIPMKRFEVFFSQYFLGLIYGVGIALIFTCSTELFSSTTEQWINFCSSHLIIFFYYYHISLLAFWICGHLYFQGVVLALLVFGAFVAYLVFQFILTSYDSTYLYVSDTLTLMKLFPFLGALSFLEGNLPEMLYRQYLMQTVFHAGLILLAVRFRPNEKTGQSMMFKPLSYVIRLVVMLLGAGSLFAIFGSVLGSREYLAKYITCLIVSIMVAYLVEMIYKKKVKVLYSIPCGVLVSIALFASFVLGIRVIEDYIPSNYDKIGLRLEYYSYYDYSPVFIFEDEETLESIVALNKDFLKVNEERPYLDELEGYIVMKYYNDEGEEIFGRRYDFDQRILREILNKDEYRMYLIQSMFTDEYEILKLIEQRLPLMFEVEGRVYLLENEQHYYLLENYLRKGLEEAIASERLEVGLGFSDSYVHVKDYDENFYWDGYAKQQLLDALTKTFGY